MSDPVPNPELVSLQGTYRIGVSPPVAGSLAPGEIYIQVPADGAAPVFFVGGLEDTVVSMVTATMPAAAASASKSDPKTDPKAEEHGPPAPPPKR